MRRSGIILHPTSLPGIAATGSIGKNARTFIDFLKLAEQQLWQTLPLVPTDDGGCPYNSTSAMAFNTNLIDLEELCTPEFDSLLTNDDLIDAPTPKSLSKADFKMARLYKTEKLNLAYNNFINSKKNSSKLKNEYNRFLENNNNWLIDFALFITLQQELDKPLWTDWPTDIRNRDPKTIQELQTKYNKNIDKISFNQFIFYKQWQNLKKYANDANIKIIGDIPIFVSHNSVDVWANTELFQLGKDGKPTNVAGVPPDYFSPEGQLWGNPIYDWKKLKSTGYQWWMKRIGNLEKCVDIIRIDHFRGFEAYWSVKATEKNAINGKWIKGPGMDFFNALSKNFPNLEFIAEDLGINTPEVEILRKKTNFPGMKVLQFAFSNNPNEIHIPHMHQRDDVVYTGTHDNNTTLGWYNDCEEHTRDHVRRYLSIDGNDIAWQMIQAALKSCADTSIIPVQDLLSQDSSYRMNTPGTIDGNWIYRLLPDQLQPHIAYRLRDLTRLYGRAPAHE